MSTRVITWADGSGVWRASVPCDVPDKGRRQAHRAIRAELVARDAIGVGYRVRVEREGYASGSLATRAIWREVTR